MLSPGKFTLWHISMSSWPAPWARRLRWFAGEEMWWQKSQLYYLWFFLCWDYHILYSQMDSVYVPLAQNSWFVHWVFCFLILLVHSCVHSIYFWLGFTFLPAICAPCHGKIVWKSSVLLSSVLFNVEKHYCRQKSTWDSFKRLWPSRSEPGLEPEIRNSPGSTLSSDPTDLSLCYR